MNQLASALKASSGAFADSSTKVGTGTLTLTVDGKSMNLELDDSNNSLAQVRDAINKASDNPGVTATIVNGTDGAHLVLSGTRTGAANGFTVSSSGGDGGLAALHYDAAAVSGNGLNVITAAQDAEYTIDGLAGHSAGNSVSGAIDGLTLNLAKLGESRVTVANDSSKARQRADQPGQYLQQLRGDLPEPHQVRRRQRNRRRHDRRCHDQWHQQHAVADHRRQQPTAPRCPRWASACKWMAPCRLDNDKLTKAIGDGGKLVSGLFGGDSGFAAQLNTQLDQWVGTNGVLASRTDSIGQQLKDLKNQQATLDSRMDALTARYQAQFTALDTLDEQAQQHQQLSAAAVRRAQQHQQEVIRNTSRQEITIMGFGYGAGAYQQVRSHGGVESADPHGLITLLMDGALERLVKARAHMLRGEVAAKGEAISRCIKIFDELRGSLDPKADPAMVGRLDSLYDYMSRRLLQANLRDDATLIDEVSQLLQPIRDSWVQIAPVAQRAAAR